MHLQVCCYNNNSTIGSTESQICDSYSILQNSKKKVNSSLTVTCPTDCPCAGVSKTPPLARSFVRSLGHRSCVASPFTSPPPHFANERNNKTSVVILTFMTFFRDNNIPLTSFRQNSANLRSRNVPVQLSQRCETQHNAFAVG